MSKKNRIGIQLHWRSECGRRPTQQDSLGWSSLANYSKHGMIAVLSDGMGGMKNGEVYSEIAVHKIVDHYRTIDPSTDSIRTLLECYAHARRAALQACPDPNEPDGGATVVAVCIRDGKCSFLSVGDSRLYLWRCGALLQLNREQTLGVLLDENAAMGYIPKEYAQSVMRNVVENNLCEPEIKRCDISPKAFQLMDGDVLLLMSDGVNNTLTEQEMTELARKADCSIADTIVEAIVEKDNPKQDNYSIIEIVAYSNTQNGGDNGDF